MSEERVKSAILGVGRWGINVAREFAKQSDLSAFVSQTDAHDADVRAVAPMATRKTLEEICADASIQAVAVATPIPTHTEIARALLSAGKHVLCEKPLALSAAEAQATAEMARAKDLVLCTGYVFVYHPAWTALKEALKKEQVKSIDMTWLKYGTFSEDIEFNLLTHHLALAYDMAGMPRSVAIHKGMGVESVCDAVGASITYDSFVFSSHIDRASQEKTHRMRAVCEGGAEYVWDGARVTRRIGGEDSVVHEGGLSPLEIEVPAFLGHVRGETRAATAGDFGVRVLQMHEMSR